MIDLLGIGLLLWAAWSWKERWSSSHGHVENGSEAAVDHVRQMMQEYGVTLEQLTQAASLPLASHSKPKRDISDIAMKVFTYLGAIFVLGGIGAYIAMFWPTMSSSMRIFITLGLGIGLFILSCITLKEGKYPRFILPLIILAACIETSGWFVYVDETFPHTGDVRKAAAFVFGIMALQEWIAFGVFKRTIILFFALLFSYGFFESELGLLGMHDRYIAMLLGGSLLCVSVWASKTKHYMLTDLGYLVSGVWFCSGIYDFVGHESGWPLAAVVTGLCLCSFAYGLKEANAPRFSGFYFLIGSAIFYAGLFDLVHHTPFELLYLGVAIALMYVHSLLESRAVLLTSTLAILGFIGYYTSEYFVNSVGWPVALILLGVAFFGVSVMALRIRRRSK